MIVWQEVHESLFTPGGDPVWECPECGFRHVYGIEASSYNSYFRNMCDKCHVKIIYPWQVEREKVG